MQWKAKSAGICLILALALDAVAQFSPQEIKQIQTYWQVEGRYSAEKEAFQPRQTPVGSLWLYKYLRACQDYFGTGKMKPNPLGEASPDYRKEWDSWVAKRYAWDEYLAQKECSTKKGQMFLTPQPSKPGPMLPALAALINEPPAFVEATQPIHHMVKFEDHEVEFSDHVKVRRMNPYYRYAEGVMHVGQAVSSQSDQLAGLFASAGVSPSDIKILSAVSLLEGGFDSINTYDTGYVSVGFIQFASLAKGSGSLGQVLLMMKQDAPEEFQSNFRKYGIDVTKDGYLVALDLQKGAATIGSEANSQIIQDKRLIAVFHRAGQKSRAFQVAQIKSAIELYYPGDMMLNIQLGKDQVAVPIRSIVQSEAGMAILMERYVNTGDLGSLEGLVNRLAKKYSINQADDLCLLEYQICRGMVYRKDFLLDASLTHPRDLSLALSRGGDRSKLRGDGKG